MTDTILHIEDLRVSYGPVEALKGVNLDVRSGEIVALVGRSGAGKSSLVNAVMQMLPANALFTGAVEVCGKSLHDVKNRGWRNRLVSIVPQDPYSWFNPMTRIGKQVREVAGLPSWSNRQQARASVEKRLASTGLDDAASVARRYPHQLSGGMRQRVAVACALVHDPPLVLADEPTSALDPESRDDVLKLLRDCRNSGKAVLIISHDRSVVDGIADRVVFVDEGQIVEQRSGSQATLSRSAVLETAAAVLDCSSVSSVIGNNTVLGEVSLSVKSGETVGVIGKSGVGKSTLCRLLLGLSKPHSGRVQIDGTDVYGMSRLERARSVQMLFQDSRGSLDSRLSVRDSIAAMLRAQQFPIRELDDRIEWACEVACFPYHLRTRSPQELSGGQVQRAALARAVALRPKVLLLDEPFNALDSATSTEVATNLLAMQQELVTAIVVVMHDLDMIDGFAHRTITLPPPLSPQV